MKKELNEQVDNRYEKLVKAASFPELLTEAKIANTDEEIENFQNKLFFTCQGIKKEVEKHFPKEKASQILEDLAVHFIAGLK